MVFRQIVARSASRVAKLCTGRSPEVCLEAALARARGEWAAGATGLGRAAEAAGLSSSVNSSGASRDRICPRYPRVRMRVPNYFSGLVLSDPPDGRLVQATEVEPAVVRADADDLAVGTGGPWSFGGSFRRR